MILHYHNCTKALNFPAKLQYVSFSWVLNVVTFRDERHVRVGIRHWQTSAAKLRLTAPLDLQEYTARQEDYLGDVIFLNNKKRILHGIILVVLYVCDSWVGIATRYGLDGPRNESRWGKVFRTHPDLPLGLFSFLYNGYRVFPRGRAAGARRWPPTPSCAEVKERVVLYSYNENQRDALFLRFIW
jgi:hypothetical protein